MALVNVIPIAHIFFSTNVLWHQTSTLIDVTHSFFTHDFHIFYRYFNISLLSHEIMLFFLKIMWIYDPMKKFILGLKTVNSVLYLPVNVLYHLHRY